MTQNDERDAARRRGDTGDAPTQALPHVSGSASGSGQGFDRAAAGRVRPSASRSAGDTGDDPSGGLGSGGRRPTVPRPGAGRGEARSMARPAVRTRRARLVLRRIDPWSVFLFSLLASIFLGIVLVVAVSVLYGVLAKLGVLDSVNDLFGEVAGDGAGGAATAPELITSGRVISGAAVLAAVDIVLLTALATLGALLYNLCATLTGGIEVTLGERD